MKQKYLSLIALAGAMFMSTSAWAQWDEPTVPELEKKNVEAVESGKTYYIMNVGAEQFITGSNSWSTQISLTRDGVTSEYSPALAIYVADSSHVFNGSKCTGVSLRLDGTFTVNGDSGNRTFTNTYLFREGDNGFMDHGAQDYGYIWNITKADNGYFRIQCDANDPHFPDAATEYAGWDSTNGPIAVDEYGELVVDEESGLEPSTTVEFNVTEAMEEYSIDWMFIEAADYLVKLDAYSARQALYELLISTTELGFDVNTDAATAVYNNPDATKSQLESAFATLKADINRAEFLDWFAGASEEDPLDVTEYAIENPNFDSDMSGWTITVGGQNLQRQARTDGQVDEAQNWVQITNFIEAWTPAPNHLGDGTISQTIYGLPQGKYVLECDAMATLQGGSPSSEDAVENAFIFIQGDNSEVRNPIKSPDTQPKHWSVTFICPEGNNALTFGLKVENTTANWISADNFQLWYYGEFKGSIAQAQLQTAITKAMTSVEKIESGIYQAYQVATEEFEAALSEAQDVAASVTDDEAYEAAQTKLEAAQAAYEASVKAYEKLGTFIGADGSASKLDEYMETASQLGDLYDELTPWEEELKDGYYDQVISTERIEELLSSFLNKIREYIKMGSIEPGADITILLDNPDFSEGTTSNVTGWTINSGSIGELAKACGNIETWHKTFDISQTITDMPAGIYDITVQGFVRHDTATDTENTYFYAGDTKTCLMTLEDQWSLDPIYTSDGPNPYLHDGNYDLTLTTPEGETGYKCNGMGGAYYWFLTEIPEELYPTFKYKAPAGQDWSGDNYYTNHIKVVLKQPGDFTIGLGTTSETDWIIWDNFKIKYIGEDLDIYAEMVREEFQKAEAAHEAEDAFITKKAEDEYAALAAKADNAGNIKDGDEALAIIEEIDQLIAYINAGNKLGESLKHTYYLYAGEEGLGGGLVDLFDSEDPAFPALLDEIVDAINDPSQFADNDAIAAKAASLKKGWGTYVMFGAEEEPTEKYDASEIIYNRDYTNYQLQEGYSAEGWTVENIGGAQAADWYEFECYNNDTINVYQKIEGLKPGFYEIAVQGYYRAGFPGDYTDSLAAVHNTYLYALTSIGEAKAPMLNAFEDGVEEQTYIGSESLITLGETSLYIPNNMEAANTYFENGQYNNTVLAEVGTDGELTIAVKKFAHIEGDWTIFTNWQLFYLGKTAANFQEIITGVQSLEAKQSMKAAQFFGIDGRQQSRLQRGINIVRMADGSVQKVMVK